jgi:hypothetical protein
MCRVLIVAPLVVVFIIVLIVVIRPIDLASVHKTGTPRRARPSKPPASRRSKTAVESVDDVHELFGSPRSPRFEPNAAATAGRFETFTVRAVDRDAGTDTELFLLACCGINVAIPALETYIR